jgi:uncharacterized protein (TIGR00369 family)
VATSPFAMHTGLRLGEMEEDRAEVLLPFANEVVTTGDLVHGGAIGTLIDVAAMAAAWATPKLPEPVRGTTVSLTVQFLSGARGQDLTAKAHVTRRGGSLCFVTVDVAGADGKAVAQGLVTYKLG